MSRGASRESFRRAGGVTRETRHRELVAFGGPWPRVLNWEQRISPLTTDPRQICRHLSSCCHSRVSLPLQAALRVTYVGLRKTMHFGFIRDASDV